MNGPRLMLQMQHIRQLSGVCFHATLSARRSWSGESGGYKRSERSEARAVDLWLAGAHLSRGVFAA